MERQNSARNNPWVRTAGVILVLAVVHFILFLACWANSGSMGATPGEPDDYDRPITVAATIGTVVLACPLGWLALVAGVSGIGWLILVGLNSLLWGAAGLAIYWVARAMIKGIK